METIKLTQIQKERLTELLTFNRLITEVYPSGIVSIVSDTMDFFNIINPDGGILATLKDTIMSRDGKVVIRPDSGDPVKIVTGWYVNDIGRNEDDWESMDLIEALAQGAEAVKIGDKYFELIDDPEFMYPKLGRELSETEIAGLIECLWEIFGGTVSSTGFKQLDSHIGAIYGDSITLERATQICERLMDKGFASTNLVYGIGSFTYQGAVTKDAIVTRDTHGFAVKSTYGEVLVEGEVKGIEIFKDPITDDGLKKSAKGLTAVYEVGGGFTMKDQATWDEVRNCAFVNVFSNGTLTKDWSLSEIRERVAKSF